MLRLLKYLLIALSATVVTMQTYAQKKLGLLDEKSQIIGLFTCGDYSKGDLYEKFIVENMDDEIHPESLMRDTVFPTPSMMARYLYDINAGKTVIDRLLQFDGSGLSDRELRRRAAANAIRSDRERAARDIIGEEAAVQDDIDPILKSNYLFVRLQYERRYLNSKGEEKSKTIYKDYLYRVVVTQSDVEQIYEAWDNPEAYKKLSFPLEYIPTPDTDGSTLAHLTTALDKVDTNFMNYSQLLSRNSIDLPRSAGVRKGDVVSIYRQEFDRNGRSSSKRIARGKVSGFDKNDSRTHFFRVSGNRGSEKNGDLAKVSHSSNISLGILGEAGDATWMAKAVVDYEFGFRKSGIFSHFLFDVGYGQTARRGHFSYNGNSMSAPWFFNVGLGYGLGKYFMGCFDVMPFVMAQWDAVRMSSREENDDVKSLKADYVRVPAGLRININIVYPLRLALEAGYALSYKLDYDSEKSDKVNFVDNALKERGAKRDGYFLSAGLSFDF